nr:hypothetical protein Iba_chr15dCG7590 [Ipomoea batatas]
MMLFVHAKGQQELRPPFLSGGELGGPAGGVRTSGRQLLSPVDGSLTEQGAATTSSRLPGGVTRRPRRSLDVARRRNSGGDGRRPRRRSLLLDDLHAATVNLKWSLSPLCDSKKQIERSWPTVLSLPPPSTARQRRSTWTALPTPRGISVPAAKPPPIFLFSVDGGVAKGTAIEKVTSVFIGPLVTQLCIALGYKAKAEWTEYSLPEATMTPLSLEDLSTMNLDDSIFSESVASSAKDPTPALSSSLPMAPQRFVKVIDWKSMQAFQYQLHLEHERLLEERDARHYELLEEVSMQINHLKRDLARRGPSTGQ